MSGQYFAAAAGRQLGVFFIPLLNKWLVFVVILINQDVVTCIAYGRSHGPRHGIRSMASKTLWSMFFRTDGLKSLQRVVQVNTQYLCTSFSLSVKQTIITNIQLDSSGFILFRVKSKHGLKLKSAISFPGLFLFEGVLGTRDC